MELPRNQEFFSEYDEPRGASMTLQRGEVGPTGKLRLKVVPSEQYDEVHWPPERILGLDRPPKPPVIRQAPLEWRVRNARHRARGAWKLAIADAAYKLTGQPYLRSKLKARVFHADGSITDYGVICEQVVTTAGANFIVDAFQNATEVENFKYHAYGTGAGAEAAGDVALATELTTQYATDNVRPTGTQTEGASANIYRSVGVLDPDSAVAITEHMLMSQAATGGGTGLDRSLFAAINVAAAGDTLETTYDFTVNTGG